MRKVLNVGGNSKAIPLPPEYAGWAHVLLDIDPRGLPDVVCDARELTTTPAAAYDSVYCSHNLEHYYRHDAMKVLAGFIHVLAPDGFAYIRVPDIGEVMRMAVRRNLDIDEVLYVSPAGPITVHDVLYGLGKEIEQSGSDFYAHKHGFTQKSLTAMLKQAGFPWVFAAADNLEIAAIAFVNRPAEYVKKLFNMPADV